MKTGHRLLGFGLGAISTAISILLFFSLLSLGIGIIKVNKGLAAFGGLLSLILFSLCELVFILFVFEYYNKADELYRLLKRFCIVTAVLSYFLTATVALRFLLLLPVFRAADLPAGHILVRRDYLKGGGCLSLGTFLLLVPKWLKRSPLNRSPAHTNRL